MDAQQKQPGDRVQKVSVHGGHSGQFCHHAKDSLEEVIRAYIQQGFTWVGITEHMPPMSDAERFPDEAADGLDAGFLQERFGEYIRLCREMQKKYENELEILVAFETETYDGSTQYVRDMVEQYRPDYLVGSVHHVHGIPIDFDAWLYHKAAEQSGGIENLYCDYFDAQHDMLRELKPAVVGHFDLIRMYDRDYLSTLKAPAVAERIERNLDCIAAQDLIVDFNLRGFEKAMEQYPSMPILKQAVERGIAVVPGDDSHGVSSVGKHYEHGVTVLAGLGVSGHWRKPAPITYS